MSIWKILFGMTFMIASLLSGSLGFFEKDGWWFFLNFNLFMTVIMIVPLFLIVKSVNFIRLKRNKKGEVDG